MIKKTTATRRARWFAVLLAATLAELSSCAIRADVTIGENGSGTVQAQLTWQPAVDLYWKDLKELDPSLPSNVLDQASLSASLDQKAKEADALLTSPRVEVTADAARLSFEVPSPAKPHSGEGLSLFHLEKTAEGNRLTLTLDRSTLQRWMSLTTYGQSPALASLFPDSGAATEAEFRDNLVYALGPYSKDAAGLVDASSVEIDLHFPSPPRRVEGGELNKMNTVVCRWPLTEVLTLPQPLRVVVDY